MDYSILPLTKELLEINLPAVLRLDQYIPGERWNESNFLMDLPGKWDASRIVFRAGEVIGFQICTVQPESLHIHRKVIDPNYRGYGIGSKLTSDAIRYASELNKKMITAKISPENKIMIAVAEHLGYSIQQRTQKNVLMVLNILHE